jgi:REP element-mobilizing transposase RayT
VFQHVMTRGIERRAIFGDDEDRVRFLLRLVRVLEETGTACLAFALMTNHYHLLLQIRGTPLARVMRRLGTGHAMAFNRRRGRVGHLYQNRYKSRIVDGEGDLRGVVRYIHLNPVKARMVADVLSLATYPWTGHATLMGRRRARFLDAAAALRLFGDDPRLARREMARFLEAGMAEGDPDPGSDAGEGDLPVAASAVEAAPLSELEEDLLPGEIERRGLRAAGWDVERLAAIVCRRLAVDPGELRAGRRSTRVAWARVAIAGLAAGVLGETRVSIARTVGVSAPAVTQALDRFAGWPATLRGELRSVFGESGAAPPRPE